MSNVSRLHRFATRPALWAQGVGPGQVAEIEAALDEVQRLLGPGSVPAIDELSDFGAAAAALEAGWRAVRATFAGEHADVAFSDATDLEDLTHRLARGERLVRSAELRHRDKALGAVRETLAELRDVHSVQGVIDAGAQALCRLGFDRSLVSRVDVNTWMTEAVHLEDDPEWAAEILAAGQANPETLRYGLPEDEARRRGRPVLVTRVQERDAVHQAVADASRSRSYVAAPIMPGQRLLGFVHGDRFFHRGDVTDFDAELIGAFAQGFSFALERALLAEELEQMRATVRRIGLGLAAYADDGAEPVAPPVPAVAGPGIRTPLHTVGPAVRDAELTRREYDVFQLMAEGSTNQQIARRLSISEGTVKSHVKHILRKLGAANRAEAVARWHAAAHAQHLAG